MFEWLGQLFGKSKQEAKQLTEKEVDDSMGQDSAPQRAPSDSLRSLLKTAIADAEEIVASIKMRAQIEAEAEAARIIAQAKLEAQKIEGEAEIAEVETKQEALQSLARVSEEVEKEIGEEYKSAYSRLSSALQALIDEGQNIEIELKGKAAKLLESESLELKEHEATLPDTSEAAVPPIVTSAPTEAELKPEAAIEEKVEEPVELQEEVTEEKVEEPVQPKLDSQALYGGDIELTIASSAELKLVSRLYNYLQTVPELRILYTRGSWDRGTTVTVVLEKPLPLISILSETPGVAVIPELLEKGGLVAGASSSPLRGGEKGVVRLKLNLKEA